MSDIVEKTYDKKFPYKVNVIYKIRVDDNNKISKLEDYEHSMLAGGLFLGALLLFISSSVGFAIDQKND